MVRELLSSLLIGTTIIGGLVYRRNNRFDKIEQQTIGNIMAGRVAIVTGGNRGIGYLLIISLLLLLNKVAK